jgi:hypothetical protein
MIHHHIVNVAAALSMSYYCKLSWERYRDISSRFGKLHQSSGGIPLYLLICVCGSDKQRGITQTQDQDGWICIGNTHVNVTFRQSPIDLLSPHVSKPMSNNTSLVPIEEILPGSIPGSPLEQFKYFSMHSLVPPVCQRTSKVCCFYQNMVILFDARVDPLIPGHGQTMPRSVSFTCQHHLNVAREPSWLS